METKATYTGQHFILHLFNDGDTTNISLSSNYVRPAVDKSELKGLADFIYQYLQSHEHPV